jgi:hypothetical protein
MKTVNLELIRTAFEKVEGKQFEKFANAAFAELVGPEYIPLGGINDEGADGHIGIVSHHARIGDSTGSASGPRKGPGSHTL